MPIDGGYFKNSDTLYERNVCSGLGEIQVKSAKSGTEPTVSSLPWDSVELGSGLGCFWVWKKLEPV